MNTTEIIKNKKTGELFRRYNNNEKGFAYVSPRKGFAGDFKYYLSDLDLMTGNGSPAKGKFKPKEWEIITLDITPAIKKAKKLAKMFGCGLVIKNAENTNAYGGFENGSNKIKVDIWGDITLVCTCGNCGDGSWVNLTNVKL